MGPPGGPVPNRFEGVYRQHHAFVWRNARRLGASDDMVDDATHEVFLVVARRLDEFEGRADLRTWLFAITLHVVRAMRRQHWTYAKRLQTYAELKRIEPRPDPREHADAAQALRQMLGQLDDKRCTVFILAELEGMTTQEIATQLGLRPGTVDSRVRAARIQLRRMIEREAARPRSSRP
ncbi:MAG TPA: sigma-70 family RNA polymerase sigma factor [Polyangiaceae bacterium]|nr:sigma-70 family RNA polymerase sigma factor [Polyangiaceae bacterium]